MIYEQNGKLIREYQGETLLIEAFGKNSFRIRITKLEEFTKEDWALLPQAACDTKIKIIKKGSVEMKQKVNAAESVADDYAEMENGNLKVILSSNGKMRFENSAGKCLIQEYEYEDRSVRGINTRELTDRGGNFEASLMLETDPKEKLYGMGQYQNGIFNLKGSVLELAQRNTQVSVPFVYSSQGYGFLWNNPAIGRASFGVNRTIWEAWSTKQIDFWITAGDSPKEVLKQYMEVTGKPPMMPEHGLGFWQCKLRYQTQEELLDVSS